MSAVTIGEYIPNGQCECGTVAPLIQLGDVKLCAWCLSDQAALLQGKLSKYIGTDGVEYCEEYGLSEKLRTLKKFIRNTFGKHHTKFKLDHDGYPCIEVIVYSSGRNVIEIRNHKTNLCHYAFENGLALVRMFGYEINVIWDKETTDD